MKLAIQLYVSLALCLFDILALAYCPSAKGHLTFDFFRWRAAALIGRTIDVAAKKIRNYGDIRIHNKKENTMIKDIFGEVFTVKQYLVKVKSMEHGVFTYDPVLKRLLKEIRTTVQGMNKAKGNMERRE